MYILLLGYPPFNGTSEQEIFKKIKKGKIEKDTPEWRKISHNAQDLLSKMLEKNYEKRLSASECLSHPWITEVENYPRRRIGNSMMSTVLKRIYNFNVKEKFQQAVIVYIVHYLLSNDDIRELENAFIKLDNDKNLKLAFEQFDTDNDGKLSIKEIKNILGDPSDEYIENFLKQIDLNEKDGISFNKFKEIMKDSLNEKKEKKLIKE